MKKVYNEEQIKEYAEIYNYDQKKVKAYRNKGLSYHIFTKEGVYIIKDFDPEKLVEYEGKLYYPDKGLKEIQDRINLPFYPYQKDWTFSSKRKKNKSKDLKKFNNLKKAPLLKLNKGIAI